MTGKAESRAVDISTWWLAELGSFCKHNWLQGCGSAICGQMSRLWSQSDWDSVSITVLRVHGNLSRYEILEILRLLRIYNNWWTCGDFGNGTKRNQCIIEHFRQAIAAITHGRWLSFLLLESLLLQSGCIWRQCSHQQSCSVQWRCRIARVKELQLRNTEKPCILSMKTIG